MQNKLDLMLHIAIGDAMGRPFEFNERRFIDRYNNLVYVNRENEKQDGIGVYTDDTQMSIGTAEMILNGYNISHENFAGHYQNAYHRDPREGYSRTIKKVIKLKKITSFISAISQILPRNTNGCIMRTLPIGLLPDVEKVKQAAIIQCSLTHFTLEAIESTILLSLTAHYYYYGYDKDMPLSYFLEQHMPHETVHRIINAWKGGEVSTNVTQTTSFCIHVMHTYDNMADLLKACIAVGGDVDSTASICMGLASLKNDMIRNLPACLYNDLEKGGYGITYLYNIDKRLEGKFPRK